MADLTQLVRWNANFVRGLAQSVLDRAKVIRTGLVAGSAAKTKPAKKKGAKKTTTKSTGRRAKRTNA